MKSHLEWMTLAQASGIEHYKKRNKWIYHAMIGFLFGVSVGYSLAWIVIAGF